MSKWLELAERCEKATGPDREIDRVVLCTLNYLFVGSGGLEMPWETQDGKFWFKGDITASLDAITALIERELPGAGYKSGMTEQGLGARGWARVVENSKLFAPQNGIGATEELARCAAFCRAMAAKESAQ